MRHLAKCDQRPQMSLAKAGCSTGGSGRGRAIRLHSQGERFLELA